MKQNKALSLLISNYYNIIHVSTNPLVFLSFFLLFFYFLFPHKKTLIIIYIFGFFSSQIQNWTTLHDSKFKFKENALYRLIILCCAKYKLNSMRFWQAIRYIIAGTGSSYRKLIYWLLSILFKQQQKKDRFNSMLLSVLRSA